MAIRKTVHNWQYPVGTTVKLGPMHPERDREITITDHEPGAFLPCYYGTIEGSSQRVWFLENEIAEVVSASTAQDQEGA